MGGELQTSGQRKKPPKGGGNCKGMRRVKRQER